MSTSETPADAAAASPAITPSAPAQITLRAPTVANAPSSTSPTFTEPSISWIEGTWHVTHSTLPMWKKARNVAITYKAIPAASPADPVKLDDLVTYQSLTGDKIKSVSGVDKQAGLGAWDWRGNGWLVIASSHWEVLGYGGVEGGEQWVVTYFAKTLFTPAGIDFYSREKKGLSAGTLGAVKEALAKVDDAGVRKLAREIFDVKSD